MYWKYAPRVSRAAALPDGFFDHSGGANFNELFWGEYVPYIGK
jgi:hypothetical protein